MGIRERVRFYFWFARRDLFERQAVPATIAVIFTLIVLNAFVLLVFGLIFGYQRAQNERILTDPLSLALYAGRPVVRNEITPEVAGKVDAKLRESLGDECAGCFPYHELNADFQHADARKQADEGIPVVSLRGRTLKPSEPFHRHLRGLFPDASEQVVYLSARVPILLNRAGGPAAARPSQWEVMGTDGATSTIAVRQTDYTFPGGHDFMVLEGNENVLSGGADARKASSVFTGSIPPEWDEPAALRLVAPILGKFAADRNIRNLFLAKKTGTLFVWQLSSNLTGERAPRIREWRKIVGDLAALLEKQGWKAAPDFEQGVRSVDSNDAATAVAAHDGLAVYVRNAHSLRGASNAVKASTAPSLPVDEDVIAQVESVAEITRKLTGTAAAVAFILLVVSILNIYTILYLRYRQQTAEIGMLKAMGFDGGSLWGIYFTEGALLASLGVAMGLCLGAVAAPALLVAIGSGGGAGFAVPWWLPLSEFGVSFLLCAFGSIVATSSARRTAPCLTLKQEA